MTDAEIQAVFRDHKDAVYRFAWRMTGSPSVAEDIAQDVFLVLVRQSDRFDPVRGTMRSFLLAIARNLPLKRWRDDGRWDELDDELNADRNGEHFAPQSVYFERREIGEVVGRAVQSLPPLQREVLILAEYEEMSLEEIARSVNAEVGTVKSRLHRARENLRHLLAPFASYNARGEKREA